MGDDWETDPDYKNDVSEKEQRWGSKDIQPDLTYVKSTGLDGLRSQVSQEHEKTQTKVDFSRGYGGTYGHESTGDQTTEAKQGTRVNPAYEMKK
eukprot:JP440722.1.p1 GENE.JP440722.1~~JP440722.1.p1  ORF type:complete len:94 (-),score=22.77 JP440722.1:54-335(-)